MRNTDYEQHFQEFLPAAKEKLTEISTILSNRYGRDLGSIDIIDLDEEKGIRFSDESNDQLFVQLLLVNGDEWGFDGVGLMMSASAHGSVWAPMSGTPFHGTNDSDEINVRIMEIDSGALANMVQNEWDAVEANDFQRWLESCSQGDSSAPPSEIFHA